MPSGGVDRVRDSLELQAFEEIVALLIYGMVLFPNPDQLM